MRRSGRLGGWVLVVWLLSAPAAAADKPLVITTLPFDAPKQQKAIFGMLTRHLSDAVGRKVVFRPSATYDGAVAALASGEADIAFLGAVAYVRARRAGYARAVLRTIRKGHATYYGVVVVRRGSEIKQLGDLKGKRVAFVHHNSTGGYLYPRLLMRSVGLDPDKDLVVSFAGGHHRVVEQVASGEVDAGACFDGAQQSLVDPESVVAIARTEPVPGDPVVVRPGLGKELVDRLRAGLIDLASDPRAESFFTFAEIDGFIPAVDSDYDRVAELIGKMR